MFLKCNSDVMKILSSFDFNFIYENGDALICKTQTTLTMTVTLGREKCS